MSNFIYCPIVWHFCGETNTRKIENIKERALGFIYEVIVVKINQDYQH